MKDLHLTDHDRLWIKTVYEFVKREKKKPTFRKIRVNLKDSLPREYNPKKIDERFVRWNGTDLTLLAVDLIDPSANVKEKANRIVSTIAEMLLSNDELQEILVKDISDLIGLSVSEIGFILYLIYPYGNLFRGGNMSNDYYGFTSIRIDDPDERIFEEYLYFKNIDDLVGKHNDEIIKRQLSESQAPEFQYNSGILLNSSSESIIVTPIFKSRAKKNPSVCFVVMPFTTEWSSEVFGNIKQTVESAGFQCLRADNQSGRIVMEDIWLGITQSAFIIADVTGTNPNVMYELGIADAVGTPTILLTQEAEKIPFDFRHYRHLVYKNTLSGWKMIEEKILSSIREIQSDKR